MVLIEYYLYWFYFGNLNSKNFKFVIWNKGYSGLVSLYILYNDWIGFFYGFLFVVVFLLDCFVCLSGDFFEECDKVWIKEIC